MLRNRFFTFLISLLLWFALCSILLLSISVNAFSSDMASTSMKPNLCLTADGNPLSGVPARMLACRDLDTQKWQIDSEGKWHIEADLSYCLGLDSDTVWFNKLVVLPCTSSRVHGFIAEVQSDNSVVYGITTTNGTYDLALDSGRADRQVWLYYKDVNNSNQQWHWFQNDLNLAQSLGCNITYPFPATDTNAYLRELACDRVAKVQPPYITPVDVVRDPTIFPGSVPQNTTMVTQTFNFDLAFKDNSYLRMSVTPANWLNTGLYAPPNQIVNMIVSNATITDVQQVSVQIGVHTDKLKPTSGNVVQSGFLRYPNVVTQIPLQIGENLIRSPYGGPIVLVSNTSVTTTIQVTIKDAVQAPYLKVGATTPADWFAHRNAAIPYGSLESNLAVVYMPASEISTLSYEEAVAIAQYYSDFGALHNELSGLSLTDIAIHQPPDGQYWHVADKQISIGWGHSGFPMMYFNDWNLGTPNDTIYRSDGTWGQYHELGHDYQMGAWSHVYGTEVTTNLFSLYAQENLVSKSRLVEEDVYVDAIAILDNPMIADKWNNDGNSDPFIQLVFLDQIRLGFPELDWQIWTQLMRRYREMSQAEYDSLNSDQLKRDRFMTLLCDITNTNITPHFEAWTISVTAEAKNICLSYPPLTQEIWRIDGAQNSLFTIYLPLIRS
ncbi:MAG: hypothetical protein H6658_21140 [Ardenticatenaceae bacterium]|nr:hypothetical protein [Ardenticatenaceae bacterium]